MSAIGTASYLVGEAAQPAEAGERLRGAPADDAERRVAFAAPVLTADPTVAVASALVHRE